MSRAADEPLYEPTETGVVACASGPKTQYT